MDELQRLSQELGYPSSNKLWTEAQRRGLSVSRKDVNQSTQGQEARQVFNNRTKYEGKITATEINDRWAADIIDYNANPSPDKSGGPPYQYILIVQDIFSRAIFVHALKNKDQETTQQAFESIVRRASTPDMLDTDNGNEFKGKFEEYLVDEKIYHHVSDTRNKNARGTLDSAIKSLRQQLARIQLVERHRDWASVLQRAAKAYNETVHSSLIGRAPYNVHGDKTLQFDLRMRAAHDIKHNTAVVQKRADRVSRIGAFRDEVPIKNKFERSFTPKFGGKVHIVKEVHGGVVVDEEGREFQTRHVQAVAAASSTVNTEGMNGGSERIDRVRLQALEPYRQRITEFVGDGKTENEVVRFMKTLGMDVLMNAGFNFRNALQLLGFTTGTGRGSSTHLVTKKRPSRTPSEAATALRRRITGKTSV